MSASAGFVGRAHWGSANVAVAARLLFCATNAMPYGPLRIFRPSPIWPLRENCLAPSVGPRLSTRHLAGPRRLRSGPRLGCSERWLMENSFFAKEWLLRPRPGRSAILQEMTSGIRRKTLEIDTQAEGYDAGGFQGTPAVDVRWPWTCGSTGLQSAVRLA